MPGTLPSSPFEVKVREAVKSVLTDPIAMPPDFKDWLIKWIEQEIRVEKHNVSPAVLGNLEIFFDRDDAQIDPLASTFTATGVKIDGLADGTYVIVIGGKLAVYTLAE